MFDNKFHQYRTKVCPEKKIIKNFFEHLSNAPLSDLPWKTKKCRPEYLRDGAFSIRQLKDQGQGQNTPLLTLAKGRE